ncbi:hypothetical protein CCMSSC00406_0008092 [Pleurotus cornucopiae]|uniref:Uncharacterized protein n=1 Tax=Pleurotus cornucopiae TaxID=5321 RepID=A0ACB7IIW6_PLECO|nr:hypothetical protein CCMSSC00406_0008092 [Pleurotus cornucopiae]
MLFCVQYVTSDDTVENTPAKDDDPDGVKLLGAADGLDRAAKLLQPLESLAASNIDAWLVIYDVAVRRNKYLQAIKALKHAQTLDPEHAELHTRLVDFKKRASAFPQAPPPPIGPLVTTSLASLLPEEVSLETYTATALGLCVGGSCCCTSISFAWSGYRGGRCYAIYDVGRRRAAGHPDRVEDPRFLEGNQVESRGRVQNSVPFAFSIVDDVHDAVRDERKAETKSRRSREVRGWSMFGGYLV